MQLEERDMKVVREAYDAACKALNLTSSDPLTGKLATTIMDLAKGGETDVNQLRDKATGAVRGKI